MESSKQKEKKENDNIKNMGDLMLQGYTMLGEHCPDCMIPCFRSRQGKTICPSCIEAYKSEPPPKAKEPTIAEFEQLRVD